MDSCCAPAQPRALRLALVLCGATVAFNLAEGFVSVHYGVADGSVAREGLAMVRAARRCDSGCGCH
jgi:hypothetical protein